MYSLYILIFVLLLAWALFIVASIYRKMRASELIMFLLILCGMTLMGIMGRTPVGYLGTGAFSVGAILQIIDKIKKLIERSKFIHFLYTPKGVSIHDLMDRYG